MSSTVRGIVMRALFEPDFHNQLLTKPEEALKDYNLTQEESDALINPSTALYRFLQPGTDMVGSDHFSLLSGGGDDPPPPPPVTVTVIVVVAIVVFVAATVQSTKSKDVAVRFGPLIYAIQQSSGVARADLVKTLINEITKDQ